MSKQQPIGYVVAYRMNPGEELVGFWEKYYHDSQEATDDMVKINNRCKGTIDDMPLSCFEVVPVFAPVLVAPRLSVTKNRAGR